MVVLVVLKTHLTEILFAVAAVLSDLKPRFLPLTGPFTTQPSTVFMANGPLSQLLITSHGSNNFGALLPINKSTFAFM